MRYFVAFLLILLAIPVASATVRIEVHAEPDFRASLLMDERTGNAVTLPKITSVTPASVFSVREGRLLYRGASVATATELLGQAQASGVNLVVFRIERNSFANPLRVLAGHPKQISRVYILAFEGGKLLWKRRVAKEWRVYQWRASLHGHEP